jgi:hypothetical protein
MSDAREIIELEPGFPMGHIMLAAGYLFNTDTAVRSASPVVQALLDTAERTGTAHPLCPPQTNTDP